MATETESKPAPKLAKLQFLRQPDPSIRIGTTRRLIGLSLIRQVAASRELRSGALLDQLLLLPKKASAAR